MIDALERATEEIAAAFAEVRDDLDAFRDRVDTIIEQKRDVLDRLDDCPLPF
jgi:hypothetical protein